MRYADIVDSLYDLTMGVARPIRETIVLGMKAEWIGKMDQVHASNRQEDLESRINVRVLNTHNTL
jgi:hypothetical protein